MVIWRDSQIKIKIKIKIMVIWRDSQPKWLKGRRLKLGWLMAQVLTTRIL